MLLGRLLSRALPITARFSIRYPKLHKLGPCPYTKVELDRGSGVKILSQMITKRWAHNMPLTYDFVREKIMLVLRLFDKIDGEKLTLDSHFVDDLGLDSLDHVEIIMMIEDDFYFEIPDKDAEKLLTPRDILNYISDKEEAYEELQRLHAHHHHHEHGHDSQETHGNVAHISAGDHANNTVSNPPKRHFSTSSSYMSDGYKSIVDGEGKVFPTSFSSEPRKDVDFDDIQKRVMKVCSKYDKIDSTKLDIASHFVDDLGLDSLDHVEIMMELEDEFGLEIPDQDAEKLMRPAEVAKYIFKKEEERALNVDERRY